MNDVTSSILQAIISKFVSERDRLNSDIIRCLEKASESPEYNAVTAIEYKIMQLSTVEKNIETTQSLHQRFMLKYMNQKLSEEVSSPEEINKNS